MIEGYSAELGLIILVGMFIAFVRERFPATVTAVLGVCVFLATGLLDAQRLLTAFANPAPITIGAMFILSGALMRTGVLDVVGNWIVARARQHPVRATLELILGMFAAAAFMNNTPVVLIMIPIVLRLAAALEVSAKKLLIPLSYLAMLSGTLTLVGTSTNLLVDGVARDQGMAPFGIFEITPIGIAVALVGTIALFVLGRFLLPDGDTDPYHSPADQQFLSEVRIPRDSPLVGRRIAEIGELKRVRVIGMIQGGARRKVEDRPLVAGDRLIIRATLAELMTLRAAKRIEIGTSVVGAVDQRSELVVEATISPTHPSIGRQIKELPFLNLNPVRLLGITRYGHVPGPSLNDTRVRAADTVLVTGSREAILALHENPNLIGVGETEGQAFRPAKAPIAIGALALAVILSALGVMSIMISALMAVGIVLATRCIDGEEAWASMSGDVLVLIFAMLAVGAALDQAGSITMLIGWIAPLLQSVSPLALLFTVYFCSSVLTEAISNNAVAVIMTPIAIGIGQDLGMDPRPLVIAVMFAASASFATPISYQTNTMVYAAGNYRFADFVRIGLPMNFAVGLTTCVMLTLLY
jgi:di/tricarboxylate transporter